VLAFYKFRFYALDQPIAVGAEDTFAFFIDPHYGAAPGSAIYRDTVLVFANTLLRLDAADTVSHRCRILSIEHPQLGAVRSIDIVGFDNVVTLSSGLEVVVNAEEHPGRVENRAGQIEDWVFHVNVEPVGHSSPNET
jgi:hypothetical protein